MKGCDNIDIRSTIVGQMRSSQLHDAVEALYAEFRVPKPRAIDGCPCCTDPEEICKLLSKNLRDLTPDDLSNYGASLFLTMGDERDFPYFLPRLLDIATSQEWWPSPEVLLDKLRRADWQGWPARRQKAVRGVIDRWFADTIAEFEVPTVEEPWRDGSRVDALLCGIAHAGVPLAPYLNELAEHPIALRACFSRHAHAFFKRKRLGDGFWSDCRGAEAEVVAFYELPRVRKLLDEG